MLIQIHMLQNYAPSNLNRDDTGSPKDAIFGGYRRGRISSQCLKRSIRHSDAFKDAFEADGMLAKRTQLLPQMVKEELESMGVDEKAVETITKILATLGGGASAEGLKSKLLIFLTTAEASVVTHKLWDHYQKIGEKDFAKLKIADLEKIMEHATPRSIDVSMFGRMTTSVAFEDVEAAVQVAHALSTNALDREYDYFTAVDDLSGESGAGMIGDVEFNSSTYYKYFNIHWENLVKNLGGDEKVAADAVQALIEAAALAQPTGKQNSFAAQNLPDFVLVEVSQKNIPVNYANAFLKPINGKYKGSLMENSITAFDSTATKTRKAYGLNGERAFFAIPDDSAVSGAEDVESLNALQAWTIQKIQGAANNG
jgi:CRISPR system Cascade subunit CasC